MPIMRCTSGGKKGYKAGKSGHCYTGKGAEGRARKQLRAIHSTKGKKN